MDGVVYYMFMYEPRQMKFYWLIIQNIQTIIYNNIFSQLNHFRYNRGIIKYL